MAEKETIHMLNPINVPPPAHFDIHAPEAAQRWDDWKLEFEAYADIVQLSKHAPEVQRGIFLHALGLLGHKTYKTFEFARDESPDDLKIIIKKFDERFAPERSEIHETYKFRKCVQRPDETFDEWITELRIKAATCDFESALDRNLRDQIVFGICDETARQDMLKKNNKPTLSDIIAMGRRAQQAQVFRKSFVECQKTDIFQVDRQLAVDDLSKRPYSHTSERRNSQECYYCGYTHDTGKCPAYKKTCRNCGRVGHFQKACRQKRRAYKDKNVSEIQEEQIDKDILQLTSLHINAIGNSRTTNQWVDDIQTQNGKLRVKLDTGADCDVISLAEANYHGFAVRTTDTKTVLEAFGGKKLRPMGYTIIHGPKDLQMKFLVVAENVVTILGRASCERLGLVKRIMGISQTDPAISHIVNEFADCFSGLGRFGQPHTLYMDPDITPTVRNARQIPIALYSKVKNKLLEMEQQGIIEKVTTHTPWCSAMSVVTKQDGSIRICIDPIDLKRAIKKPDYPMETIENVVSRMANAKYFSILDGVTAFWQIPVDEQSSRILTFSTPFGRFKYKRLPYGIPDASEVFQQRAKEFVEDLQGVEVMIDDFLVWGKDRQQHDERLKLFLHKARKCNLKLNKGKAQFAVQNVKYCGHIITANGLMPDPKKIEAINNYECPKDRPAVQRLLGMLAYLSKFIKDASEITAPLRKLIVKDKEFDWSDEQEKSFRDIKNALSSLPTLAYYDPNEATKISVDASSSGLGAVLMQNDRPIAYASRALTPTQIKYAQIEKELLAVVFGCQRFEKYVFGKTFTVETDHRPLEYIFRKPLSTAPARLQRMLLTLQRFRIQVQYSPGPTLYIADALSRAHLKESSELDEDMQIAFVSAVSLEKWQQFERETDEDEALKQLKEIVLKGWPTHKSATPEAVRPYWTIKHELTIMEGVVCCGDRIVVPKTMRPDMLRLIHEGHLGMELCKRRAREVLFWPGMNSEIEQVVATCASCQRHRRANQRESLILHEIPRIPFLKVAADFFEFKKKNYMIVVDYTSGFIDIQRTASTGADEAMEVCRQTFRRFGIPQTLVSDNMPFSSRRFRDFAKEWGVDLTTSSPDYPQSNGLVERNIQTVKKIMEKCQETQQDYNLALLNLNNSPREGRMSPAQVLMGRKQRTKLSFDTKLLAPLYPTTTKNSEEQRIKQKQRYDSHSKDLQPLKPGQPVRMRLRDCTWRDAVIVRQLEEPRSYLVKSGNFIYRRNRKYLTQRLISEDYLNERTNTKSELVVNEDGPTITTRDTEINATDSTDIEITTAQQEASGLESGLPRTQEPSETRTSIRPRTRPAYLSDYVEQ